MQAEMIENLSVFGADPFQTSSHLALVMNCGMAPVLQFNSPVEETGPSTGFLLSRLGTGCRESATGLSLQPSACHVCKKALALKWVPDDCHPSTSTT